MNLPKINQNQSFPACLESLSGLEVEGRERRALGALHSEHTSHRAHGLKHDGQIGLGGLTGIVADAQPEGFRQEAASVRMGQEHGLPFY